MVSKLATPLYKPWKMPFGRGPTTRSLGDETTNDLTMVMKPRLRPSWEPILQGGWGRQILVPVTKLFSKMVTKLHVWTTSWLCANQIWSKKTKRRLNYISLWIIIIIILLKINHFLKLIVGFFLRVCFWGVRFFFGCPGREVAIKAPLNQPWSAPAREGGSLVTPICWDG